VQKPNYIVPAWDKIPASAGLYDSIGNWITHRRRKLRMEVKKYWRNVIRGPFFKETEPGMTGMSLFAHHDEYKNGATLGYHCINTNYEVPFAHSHDFHELLCFIGGNPENINDLGAEISICLGDELEEHIITSATVVSIPPGLKHCPLKVKKITKPFVFLEISTTKEYGQGAQMSDGTFEQQSIADQQSNKSKKSRPESKKLI
jgi:hypothetical protein